MFSGIIAAIGSINQASDRDGGLRLVIATKALDLSDVQIGDSIAVNGVCLTVIEHTAVCPDTVEDDHLIREGQPSGCSRNRLASPVTCHSHTFTVEVSRETLNCTVGL